MNPLTSNKNVVIIAAAVIAIFGILNALDLRNQTFSGFWTDGNNTVTRVFPNSPAQQAGFAVGDRILVNGGIDVTDAKALSRRERAAIGQARDYVVEREGQQQTLTLSFAGLPGKQMALGLAGLIIGFGFLICGLLPYFKVQNRTTALLALTGLGFGLIFIGWPYVASYAVRTILAAILVPVIYFSLAVFLHFMLAFPRPKAWLGKKNAMWILYGPAIVAALFLLFLIIVQPAATSGLNTFYNAFTGLIVAGYLGLAVVVMVRTYLKTAPQERTAFGLNVMVAGIVIGMLPVLISVVVGIVAPKVVLPGQEFYFLTFVLLPIAFAYAVLKTTHSAREAPPADLAADPQTA